MECSTVRRKHVMDLLFPKLKVHFYHCLTHAQTYQSACTPPPAPENLCFLHPAPPPYLPIEKQRLKKKKYTKKDKGRLHVRLCHSVDLLPIARM